MTDDNGGDSWAFSESRDWLEGRHEQDSHLPPHPGEVADREARRTLTAVYQAFERMARDGRIRSADIQDMSEHPAFHDLRQAQASESLAYAIGEGHSPRIRHLVGSQEASADVSGMRAMERMQELVGRDPAMFYIFGMMGSGKTFLGSLMAWLWQRIHPEGEVASNIRTLEPASWIDEWGELKEWVEEEEEVVLEGEQIPKLYLLDEASSVASGRGEQGYQAAMKLGQLTFKIRKYGGSLIIIGHDGKDVSPIIRELSIAVRKTGKKSARFYHDVKNREGRNPLGPEMTGIPVPPKEWQPNTYDMADFYWQSSDGSEEIDPKEFAKYTVLMAREIGMTGEQAANLVTWSESWVYDRWDEFGAENGEADGELERLENKIG